MSAAYITIRLPIQFNYITTIKKTFKTEIFNFNQFFRFKRILKLNT